MIRPRVAGSRGIGRLTGGIFVEKFLGLVGCLHQRPPLDAGTHALGAENSLNEAMDDGGFDLKDWGL